MTMSFRSCAEYYLQQWYELDRDLVAGFSSGPVTCELLAEMSSPTKYKVARTISGHGVNKYRHFANLLNSHRFTSMTRNNVAAVITGGLAQMAKYYPRQFLSALSKAFWMMKGHPVVIYDSNAREGLQHHGLPSGNGDYNVYFNSWFTVFDNENTRVGLDDAVDWLLKSDLAKAMMAKYKIPFGDVEKLVRSDLFRNRILDIYLFYYRGATQASVASAPLR
jgi:hypothetical protein